MKSSSRHTLVRMMFAPLPAFVASVIMATTIVACQVSNPMAPEPIAAPGDTAPYAASLAPCPSFHDACVQGHEGVLASCPPDESYRKPGDHKKCVQAALKVYLHGLDTCFTQSELSTLRHCILGSIPTAVDSSGGAGKTRPESLPGN